MFSIPYLIAQLYPRKSQSELAALAEQCATMSADYDTKGWLLVKREDLSQTTTQLNLARTLWQLQFAYHGVAEEILRSLELWSDDRTIVFFDFEPETQEFYERYFAFLGFTVIGNLPAETIVKLLGTRFLVIAAAWDIPIYDNLSDYFARYTNVYGLHRDALYLAVAMEQNRTLVGESGKSQQTVAQWISGFNDFFGTSFADKVDEFSVDNVDTNRLGTDIQYVLNKILTVYYGLQAGFIWRDITDVVPAGYERGEVSQGDADEEYLKLFAQFDAPGVQEWLESFRDVVQWLWFTKKDEVYVNRLFYLLTQKADLSDDKQVEGLTDFIETVQAAGWSLGADLLYFDETDGAFHWNPDIVQALKEEVEYLEEQKKFGAAAGKAASADLGVPPADLAAGIKELTS